MNRKAKRHPSRSTGSARSWRYQLAHVEPLEPRLVLDSTVVFSELMYNPSAAQELEWLELQNLMSVDMDISNWRIDGVGFEFPRGTVLDAGGFVVVAKSPQAFAAASGFTEALGPYGGNLSNTGETLRLINNSDRVMDEMSYHDNAPWPVGADGSGASLAKLKPDAGTTRPDNWTASDRTGGTPGAPNFDQGVRLGETVVVIPRDQQWRYDDSGTDFGRAWTVDNFNTDDPNGDGDLSDRWKTGRALLGNVGPEFPLELGTVIDPDPATHLFRTEFTFDGAAESTKLLLNAIVDDGAVVYLNGQEVSRINMPSGPIEFDTPAESFIDVAGFGGEISIPGSGLRVGNNILAVEVHQAAPEDPTGGSVLPISVMRVTPQDGFSMVWDGTDGRFFDASAPPAGAQVPLNRALASEGAVAFAGSDLGPEIGVDFHQARNLNDGFYGNSNSWIGGDNNPAAPVQFAGIRFAEPVMVESIAWGRDNGNDVSDACGGQCSDRTSGTYALQYTTVAVPGEDTQETDDAATGWKSIGFVTYRSNQDTDPGGGFTNFLRHEYDVRRLGQPIEATGVRIVVPKTGLEAGTAIDEIEVYSAVATTTSDVVFGTSLAAAEVLDDSNRLSFNEVAAAADPMFFVELMNHSSRAVDLSEYTIVSSNQDATPFLFIETVVPPGGLLKLDRQQLGFETRTEDRLFLFAPGQSSLIDAVRLDDTLRGRSQEHGREWLYPARPTPSAENVFELESDVVINEILYHAPGTATNEIPATFESTPLVRIDDDTIWRYRAAAEGLPADWAMTAHTPEQDDWQEGPALIGYEASALVRPIRTELANPTSVSPPIISYYFEREFEFGDDPNDDTELVIRHLIDDGAVFYLNGQEVLRFRMPGGEVDAQTLGQSVSNASLSDLVSIPTEHLVRGTNRLSVEVHQSSAASNDVVFGVELFEREMLTARIPAQPYTPSEEEWIEIYNRSPSQTIDLTGWRLDAPVEFTFDAGLSISPKEYRLIARDADALRAKYPELADVIVGEYTGNLSNREETIRLIDRHGNPADEVHYFDGGRWHDYADGGGSSLELIDSLADNNVAEAWAASNEGHKSQWQTIRYRDTVTRDGFTNGVTSRFHEFIFGMLDAGEVLIDDVSVIEDPEGAAIERIQNGTFAADTLGQSPERWRIGGTHQGVVSTDPDDAGNQVLRLIASGAAEDRLNHAETTFVDNAALREGTSYEISFRARWMGGSNQLNSHLYFDRLSRTTRLVMPDNYGTPGKANSNAAENIGPTFQGLTHAPVIPQVGEPVTVSVVPTDPQGVTAVQLWYSVDGGEFQTSPMSGSPGGEFSGVIPGQNREDAVQFYVSATDGLGVSAFFPPDGPNSNALYRVEDGQARDGVHNFRIVMTPDNTSLLHERTNVTSNARLGATVIYNESEVYYDAGVRLKGSNAGRGNSAYLGFNIAFDPTQLFRGVHDSVAIDRSGRSSPTPQTQDEILIKHIGNQAGGIPYMYDDLVHFIAPRRTHSRSALLMMARYGDEFLDSQFDNGSDGTVFKLDIAYVPNGTTNGDPESPKVPFPYSHPQPTKDLQDLGDDKELYRSHILIRNNRNADDYRQIIAASKALSLRGDELLAAAPEVIDIDQWARVFALQSLTGAADVYTRGGLHHNMDFYVRPSDNRVLALPWDWDFAFTASPSQGLIGTTGNGGRLMNSPGVRRLYHGHLLDIINTTFNNEYMDRWIDHYGEVANQNLGAIKNYIGQRRSYVLRRLPEEIPFEVTTGGGADFSTDQTTVTIAGQGWIDVRDVHIASTGQTLDLRWLDDENWEAELALAEGANTIDLVATDHQGQVVGSDTLVITSSAANPVVASLRITEINYNPAPPTTVELASDSQLDNNDFEFLEFRNVGTLPLNLSNVRIDDGVEFTFPAMQLQPDEYALVVGNASAFRLRYGDDTPVAGQFDGRLNNGGERLVLLSGSHEIILDFAYGDNAPWPERADGVGGTLELIADSTPADQFGKYYRWRGSPSWGGSPGAAPAATIGVVINEVLASSTPPATPTDSIELFNNTDGAIDLSGWYLSDSGDDLLKFRIPQGTILNANGYVVFDEGDFNPTPLNPGPNDFALSGTNGDDVWLVMEQDGLPSTFVDDVHFGASPVGESFGRVNGHEHAFVPLESTTLGAANSDPRAADIVISEIHYHSGAISAEAAQVDASLTRDDLEFIEIYNSTAQPMELTEWRIRGGVEFDFPAGTMLPSQEALIVISFNPNSLDNATRLAAFRTQFGIDASVRMLGGYSGQLHDDVEPIWLQRAGFPTPDAPNAIPRLWEDAVIYDDVAPWPLAADGAGMSLSRTATLAWGLDAASWRASTPTPGLVSIDLVGDFSGNGTVGVEDVDLLSAGIRAGDAEFDITGDGLATPVDLTFMIKTVIGTSFGDANLNGVFESGDLVAVFRAGEYEDGVAKNSTWAEGDWNGDGDFGSGDLVQAFRDGGYVSAARDAMSRFDAFNLQLAAAAVDRIWESQQGSRLTRGKRIESSAADISLSLDEPWFDV